MKVFDCQCEWRFIIGGDYVYGPIYLHDLPGHFKGAGGCYSRGRMMPREKFEDDYADCAARAMMASPAYWKRLLRGKR